MEADLYINHHSLKYNGKDDLKTVFKKLTQFCELRSILREFPNDNVVFLDPTNLLKTEIFPGMTIENVLYNQGTNIPKDIWRVVMSLFSKDIKKTDADEKDILEYLELEEENLCHGILVMNLQPDYKDNWQVISTVDGWRKFRRHYLKKYPQDVEHILHESKQCFPVIKYSTEIRKGFDEVYPSHSDAIIIGLIALNDDMIKEWSKTSSGFWQFLDDFAKGHGIKEASRQGKAINRTFIIEEKERKEIVRDCQAHLKIYKDKFGNEDQHCRIYFAIPEKDGSYIFVGNICTHL